MKETLTERAGSPALGQSIGRWHVEMTVHSASSISRERNDTTTDHTRDATNAEGPRANELVIVCGLRGVGLRTVEQLHISGVPVVVIDGDHDAKLAQLGERMGRATDTSKLTP